MKYIDNLIAWGDQLFSQDTIETINLATQLYVWPGSCSARARERPAAASSRAAQTYAELMRATLDAFSNGSSPPRT